jgi:hypothetical protein
MLQEREPELFDVIVSFLECKDRQCHFPITEPSFDMLVCGAPTMRNSPYCAIHHHICRTKVKL